MCNERIGTVHGIDDDFFGNSTGITFGESAVGRIQLEVLLGAGVVTVAIVVVLVAEVLLFMLMRIERVMSKPMKE